MEMLVGFVMGLVYVAPPGPVNVESLRRGLAGGPGVALALQVGALIGDLGYALLALRGAGLLLARSPLEAMVGLAGTALLIYLGGSSLRDGWCTPGAALAAPTGQVAMGQRAAAMPLRSSLLTGAMLSVANPYAAAFWLALGTTALQQTHDHPTVFLASFLLGDVLWVIGFPALIGWGAGALTQSFFRCISIACSVALICFGLALGHTVALP